MSSRACCYVTGKSQLKLSVPAHLDEYVTALFCMCPDMPHYLIGLLHFSKGRTRSRRQGALKEKPTGIIPLLGVSSHPHLGSVLTTDCLIKDLSA